MTNQDSMNSAQPTGGRNRGVLRIVVITVSSLLVATAALGIAYAIFFNAVSKSSIEVVDQSLGETITVKKAVIKRGSFIIIYARGRFGAPGIRIAQTEYLIPDTYTDFSMNLVTTYQVEGAPQRIELQPGDRLTAVIHEDTNEDQRPDPALDRPTRNLFGKLVSSDFILK